jgi:hypothetical protein
METLTVFHYHLLTGGISQVIAASLSSLIGDESAPPVSRLRLICGIEENAEQVREKIRSAAAAAGRDEIEIELHILPALRYISEMDDRPSPREIETLLLERFGGDLWWIHNYHLGKNPPFTEALLRIAERRPAQKMVFHIHDFPESGRFENLELLYAHIRLPWYPVSPNVRYAVINSRDYQILRKAGIPPAQLFLLDNPVLPVQKGGGQERADERSAHSPAELIRDYCSSRASRWVEGGRLLLYPVRTIRRKNVLEAGLLAELLPQPLNLLVTLPGLSAQQKAYSDFIETCFADGLIPGMWPVGAHLDDMELSFPQLTASADAVISSSIQEGFGYLFLDSLRWQVPLVARRLDIIEGMEEVFDDYPAEFYTSVLVPLSPKEREELEDTYAEKVLPLIRRVLAEAEAEQIAASISRMCLKETVDFSFLSPAMQRKVLERLENSGYRDQLYRLNEETLDRIAAVLDTGVVDKEEKIETRFGPRAHAETLRRIIGSFGEPAGKSNEGRIEETARERVEEKGGEIHVRIRRRFTRLDDMRLLYYS